MVKGIGAFRTHLTPGEHICMVLNSSHEYVRFHLVYLKGANVRTMTLGICVKYHYLLGGPIYGSRLDLSPVASLAYQLVVNCTCCETSALNAVNCDRVIQR